MRIVHIVEDLSTGGLEQVIAALVTGMATERFDSSVWCLSAGGEVYDRLQAQGVDVRVLGMPAKPDLRFIRDLASRLTQEHVDIVHCHGYTGATVGRVAAMLAKTPVKLAHMHSTYWDFSPKQRCIEWILSWFSDRIICCSQAVAGFVRRNERVAGRRITVIYNGIDVSRFNVARDRPERSQIIVGCVASLVPHKGHRYLLEAAAHVKKHPGERMMFRLAGDGLLRNDLEQYCRDLGINADVEFLGCIQDIPRFLAECDIVVLPSAEREGLGIALLEAMAAGIAVIGTQLGGIPEVIHDRVNGLLVPPADAAALAQAIITLATDIKQRQRLADAGRKIVSQKFSQQAMCGQTEQLYQELYNGKNIRH